MVSSFPLFLASKALHILFHFPNHSKERYVTYYYSINRIVPQASRHISPLVHLVSLPQRSFRAKTSYFCLPATCSLSLSNRDFPRRPCLEQRRKQMSASSEEEGKRPLKKGLLHAICPFKTGTYMLAMCIIPN